MDRTIFIGDIHGCYDETVQLMKELQLTNRDHVVFLGDYIDRGPENARCCDLVREREQVQGMPGAILGNHEDRHLEHEDGFQKHGLVSDNIPPTHVATRLQLRPEHYDWFRSLPLYIRVPEHNAVAVHAGVFPGRPIEEQKARHLLHVQMLNPTKTEQSIWPSKVPSNEVDQWRFWTNFYDGQETVVFGHSVLDRPLITDRLVGIDGGAVFGRQLHAWVLPEKRLVTVNGTKDYGRGRRGRPTEEESIRGGKIRTYLVHGDISTFS